MGAAGQYAPKPTQATTRAPCPPPTGSGPRLAPSALIAARFKSPRENPCQPLFTFTAVRRGGPHGGW
jgi:hypothetical protein